MSYAMRPSPATVVEEEGSLTLTVLGWYARKSILFGVMQMEAPESMMSIDTLSATALRHAVL